MATARILRLPAPINASGPDLLLPGKSVFKGAGIGVFDVRHWLDPRAVASAAKAFPFAPNHRHTVVSTYPSDQVNRARAIELFKTYGAAHPQLPLLIPSMRAALLNFLPGSERSAWAAAPWFAVLARFDGTTRDHDEPLHAHRDFVVATLAMEGPGSRAKNPTQDISRWGPERLSARGYAVPGIEHAVETGHLALLDGVHDPNGGFHGAAAPIDGKSPPRFIVAVEIDQPGSPRARQG